MEAISSERKEPGVAWVARLVELLQPLSTRADQLGSMPVFAGLKWSELEAAAGHFEAVEVRRGARLTVQGQADSRLWLIVEGEALVSADARPLRVAGHGDAAGVPGMLYRIASPETTIALGPMRTLVAGLDQFHELVADVHLRRRLTAMAGDQTRARRLARPR